MLPLGYFGIESSGLNLVVDLLILFIVVLYLSLIYWTYADARRRILDPMLVGCATAASLFPFVGTNRVHDPASSGVPGGRARARTGGAGGGGAPARTRPLAVPALRLPDRARLRPLSKLPAQAEGALRQLLASARPGVDDLPVLRDGGSRRARRLAARAGAVRRRRSTPNAPSWRAAGRSCRPETELAAGRPETARAKATRERQEREREAMPPAPDDDELAQFAGEQETRATPVAASEPASGARGAGRSSRRARPSG